MSYQDIPGRAAYLWIYDEWLKSVPRQGAIVVEVGVALGKSIAYLCERLREEKRDDISVYAVDAWGGFARNGEQTDLAYSAGGDFTLYCKTLIQHSPYTLERVKVLRGMSSEVILPGAYLADLVILDADHVKEMVLEDLDNWTSQLYSNSWIGGDDYMPEYQGVIDAIKEFFEGENALIEKRYDFGWGTWLKRK